MSESDEWGKGIQTKLIKDSLNVRTGHRLTTWVLKYPRFVHAELMTHRQFSRNSSSSRAIPVDRLIQKVIDDPVYPSFWGKNQKGMQSREPVDVFVRGMCGQIWDKARESAIAKARDLASLGLHKQLVNRIIEPWMHIVVIMSTTTLSNWFALRDHPDAQPEIAELARKMRYVVDKSQPKQLEPFGWHIPFIRDEEWDKFGLEDLKKIAVGRCARVSYLTHDGERDPQKDIALHDFLVSNKPPHVSPFEHVAMAVNRTVDARYGNFIGWKQLRKFIHNECVEEERYGVKSGRAVLVTD